MVGALLSESEAFGGKPGKGDGRRHISRTISCGIGSFKPEDHDALVASTSNYNSARVDFWILSRGFERFSDEFE